MIWYVLIAFTAILLGMFTSVKAFGTGGKRKKIFQDIYFSVEDVDGIGVLYTKTGEYSAILKIENPVQKYSANIDNYYEFTNLLTALAQTLGEGYAIHKQDVFIKKQFHDETNDNHEFLSESYFRYFTGRTYTDVQTYLIITQENKKSHLFSFDNKKWRDFLVKIRKVKDQLKDSGVDSAYLDGASEATIFWKVVIPMSRPIIVYTVISSFLSPWMDFVYAKLLLNSGISSQWTVAIGLYNMLDKSLINTYFGQFCAGGVLVSIPISVLFVIMQKFYVEGITGGAVKG